MTEKEYEFRLRENKWFYNPQELIDYRLPVVQYFMTNFSKGQITIKYNKETDFALVNQAFLSIRNSK